MLTKLNHVLLAGVVALACSSCQTEKKADYQVIPLPQEVVLTQEKPFLLRDVLYINLLTIRDLL